MFGMQLKEDYNTNDLRLEGENMKYIWIEVIKFLKNNIVKLLIGTSIIALLFVGSSYINSNRGSQPNEESTESPEDTEDVVEGEPVEFYPESEPVNFYYFVETPDGRPFTNNLLIEQYITSPSILEEAAIETGTNLNEIVENTENTALVDYNESGETKVIGIRKNANTHLQEFHVNIGNEADNFAIADFFFSYIINAEFSLLEDKNLYVFQEPQTKEISLGSSLDDDSDEAVVTEDNILQDIIIGIILGGVATTGLLIISTLFSKKLIYSFSYSINAKDYFLLVDSKLNYQDELKQLLLNPTESNIIVVNEDKKNVLNDNLLEIIANKDIKEYNSFTKINDIQSVDRLIYVINENKTTRNWYNKQRRMERSYDIPVVVLQLNNN